MRLLNIQIAISYLFLTRYSFSLHKQLSPSDRYSCWQHVICLLVSTGSTSNWLEREDLSLV